MVSGGQRGYKLKEVLRHLINDSLSKSAMKGFEIKPASTKFDPYIYSTFQAFSENKQQITLYLLWLNGIKNNKMRDLMMYSMENNDKKRDGDDTTNLFKPELLRIFKNVKTLNIIPQRNSFSFSFRCSVSLII